jgi:hypothetical protein
LLHQNFQILLVARQRVHYDGPGFVVVSGRLEKIKEKAQAWFVNGIGFLAGLLPITRDMVETATEC